LRGVAKITAVTLAVEVGTFRRFERATQLMSYTGMVPSERSSGPRERRGAITKAGNGRLRRVPIEAAHHYRHQPRLSNRQRALRQDLDPRVLEIAWKAQLSSRSIRNRRMSVSLNALRRFLNDSGASKCACCIAQGPQRSSSSFGALGSRGARAARFWRSIERRRTSPAKCSSGSARTWHRISVEVGRDVYLPRILSGRRSRTWRSR
jgi:hypothetical protein